MLLNKIAPAVARFVDSNNMHITNEEYDQDSFGNILIEAESKKLKLKIIRDREQIFVEICSLKNNHWHLLKNVLSFITGKPLSNCIEDLMIILSENKEAVFVAIDEDPTKNGLENFEKAQSTQFINKLFPPRKG